MIVCSGRDAVLVVAVTVVVTRIYTVDLLLIILCSGVGIVMGL